MATGLDRRTFLTRAAVAGGGLLSLGAVERLVAADALGTGRRPTAQPYGPLRRTPDQRGIEVLALPAGFSYVTFSHTGSTMSDGNPTPLALDGMGVFAGGRHHGTVTGATAITTVTGVTRATRTGWCGSCATPRTATPPARRAACSATAAKAYDPTGFGGTATLVYDERRRELVEDFVSLNGTIVNCAGGRSYRDRYWLTGEETVGGPKHVGRRRAVRQAPRLPVRDARRPRAGRAGGGRADRRRRPLLPRGGGRRPAHRHRVRDRGPGLGRRRGLLPLHAERPRRPGGGGTLEMLKVAGRQQVDLREGQQRGRRLPVEWVRIEDPDPGRHVDRRPQQHVQPGLERGRREVQPPRGLLGGRRHDLLRLHQRRRREERRRQLRRLQGGLRPGLGVPAGARPPRRRHADARLRVAVGRGVRRAGQHDGHAARRPPPVRGRPVHGVRGHAPARAGDREHQPADRGDAAGARRSSSRSTCSTSPSSRAPASARAARRCSSTCSGARGSTRTRSRG